MIIKSVTYHRYRCESVIDIFVIVVRHRLSGSFDWMNPFWPFPPPFIDLTIFTEILNMICIGCPRHCRIFVAFLLDVTWDLLFICRNYTYNVPDFFDNRLLFLGLWLWRFIGTRTRTSISTATNIISSTNSTSRVA